ncbi:hypothetical protein LOTGIDRAFT_151956 [Lottia gigantea]|uniref:Uncharacterized protein n=1 Tax=Lottia gigantea TaxID=225164 RepID=V4CRL2_LOTGI|nr:hypothetical protein LOTGIDRAFT_151956 [Lottia gigantea]ESP05155.1 hypothetical protein LOTGIDRAFT_151956 [Lottia gigantea]
MAKTKRINRNFYDIVEKAKCKDDTSGIIFGRLHEMKEMNLMDDGEDIAPPNIIEIPLKDLGAKIDIEAAKDDTDQLTIEDENSHSRELLLVEDVERGLASQCRGTDNSSTLSNRSLERLFCEDNPSSSSSSSNNTPNNAVTYKTLNYCNLPTSSRARYLDTLPNGHIFGGGFEPCDSEITHNRLETPSVLFKALTDESHNYNPSAQPTTLLPKTNNMVRNLLHKTQSYQDHLCSVDDAVPGTFSMETVTKEELLIMWKTSEIELSKQLEQALREKAKLERKLAQLQHHSPV